MKEYFKSLQLAELPKKAHDFISSEILTDEDIDLLDENDEDFLAVKELIETEFPDAVKPIIVEPKIEPILIPKPTKEILSTRLKIVKKMLDKNATPILKARVKIIEKMIANYDKEGFGRGGHINAYDGEDGEIFHVLYQKDYGDNKISETVFTQDVYAQTEEQAKSHFVEKYPTAIIDSIHKQNI